MTIFYAALPIIGWGLMPILAKILKGSAYAQLLGTSISAFLFSFLFSFFIPTNYSLTGFIVSLFSGVFWSFGQLYQFKAITLSTVSKVMPLSNGSQLIFTTLWAVLLLREWYTASMIALGIFSLVGIICGILLTNYSEQKELNQMTASYKYINNILLSSLFLSIYVILNRLFAISSANLLFPQAIGMLSISVWLFITRRNKIPKTNERIAISKNLLTGLFWSIANIGMFITSESLGVSTSFALSQCCVILSTLGGILIFHEKKSKKERVLILVGILLMMLSVFGLSRLK